MIVNSDNAVHFSDTMSEIRGVTPPHSLEAEQSVLGGLLIDNRSLDSIIDTLSDNDFYRLEHKLIYRTITALLYHDLPADAVTVHEELERREQLAQTGGLDYLKIRLLLPILYITLELCVNVLFYVNWQKLEQKLLR